MDKLATIHELKEKVRRFCEDRDWDQFHGAKDLAIGIITESSELLERFRFKSPEEIDAMLLDSSEREIIEEELADIMFFLIRFAQRFDIDLSATLNDKIAKNNRNYPIEKSRGSNKKYDEF